VTVLMLEGFLLGVVATTSLIASVCFLKFWTETRDLLFMAFSALFLIQLSSNVLTLFYEKPNEGNPFLYTIRLLSFLFLLLAILRKNSGKASG
jgi:hypothetical protein